MYVCMCMCNDIFTTRHTGEPNCLLVARHFHSLTFMQTPGSVMMKQGFYLQGLSYLHLALTWQVVCKL